MQLTGGSTIGGVIGGVMGGFFLSVKEAFTGKLAKSESKHEN
jgi:hypothetical protein